MDSVLDPARIGWCPLGIQSLGLVGILLINASLWGAKLILRERMHELVREFLGCHRLTGGYPFAFDGQKPLESDDTGLWPPRFPLGISKAWIQCWISYG